MLQQVIDATFAALAKDVRKDNLATALGFTLAAAIQIDRQGDPRRRCDEADRGDQ